MADAFTPLNNLVMPEYNADEDTWGTLLNTVMAAIDAQITACIYGLTLSTAGGSATFGIASGGASGMTLASAYTKTTSAWSLGSGGGALDAGTIAINTWYHVYLIQRIDTGVVDILVSTNATTPAMPANYTRKRVIGSLLTDASSHWVFFTQWGNQFLLGTPTIQNNGSTPGGTTEIFATLGVPTGRKVEAIIGVGLHYGGSGGSFVAVTEPDITDRFPAVEMYVTIDGKDAYVELRKRTNTAGQVRLRFSQVNCTYDLQTNGWIDPRGSW